MQPRRLAIIEATVLGYIGVEPDDGDKGGVEGPVDVRLGHRRSSGVLARGVVLRRRRAEGGEKPVEGRLRGIDRVPIVVAGDAEDRRVVVHIGLVELRVVHTGLPVVVHAVPEQVEERGDGGVARAQVLLERLGNVGLWDWRRDPTDISHQVERNAASGLDRRNRSGAQNQRRSRWNG